MPAAQIEVGHGDLAVGQEALQRPGRFVGSKLGVHLTQLLLRLRDVAGANGRNGQVEALGGNQGTAGGELKDAHHLAFEQKGKMNPGCGLLNLGHSREDGKTPERRVVARIEGANGAKIHAPCVLGVP